jgi:hypothetical protein
VIQFTLAKKLPETDFLVLQTMYLQLMTTTPKYMMRPQNDWSAE